MNSMKLLAAFSYTKITQINLKIAVAVIVASGATIRSKNITTRYRHRDTQSIVMNIKQIYKIIRTTEKGAQNKQRCGTV